MKNREFYKEQILDIACKGWHIAVEKDTDKVCACSSLGACKRCLFNPGYGESCSANTEKWANAEYVEHCPFEKDELVEVSDDGTDWRIRHFAGISNDENYPYFVYNEGYTSKETIFTSKYRYCRKHGTLGGLIQEGVKTYNE